ncbi:MAG: AraC family transcriptional regulator [Desulfobacterales bacterium]|nr:AraC family transcriptional regulator [Desulfobacterales bacterium]
MLYTNLAVTKNVFWKMLEYYGQDPEPIFLEAGIDPERLKNSEDRIRFSSAYKVLVKLSEISGDPCFGLRIIKFWHPSYMHALGYAWLASQTLREALNRFVRYSRIISEAGGFLVEEDSESFLLMCDSTFTKMRPPEAIDATMTIIVHMCRLNLGSDFKPISVNFVHSEPSCSEQFFDYFKSEVNYDKSRDSILFSLADIDEQLPGSNPHLASLNEKVITKYLSGLDKENILHRVKACITDMLQSGSVVSDAVAKNLGLSKRSLQRRLQEEGTSFMTLKDEVRKELSHNYVRDSKIDIIEIAFLLGYSDQSAFSRSYKRMTGMSPSEVRGTY